MLLILMIATVAALTLVELRLGARLDSNRLLNVGIWAFRQMLWLALFPVVALSVPYALLDAREMPWVVGFILYFIAVDLGEYLFHRAQHRFSWMWRMHSLHHSDADMNATTTERHFWGDQFLKMVTIWLAASLFIRPTPAMVGVYALMSLWNYVAHSAIPLNFGRFSWLLNSPAYHRRHHSRLPEHYNSNYAALLPIWDVLLGSYHRPGRDMPPTGLDVQPSGFAESLVWPLRSDLA